MPLWFNFNYINADLFFLVRPPYIVSLLALLAEYADLSDAADGKIATGYSDLLLAQIAVQMQMDLVLIDGAVKLGIEDHRCRTRNVVLTRIVVVALVIVVIWMMIVVIVVMIREIIVRGWLAIRVPGSR